MKIYLVPNLDKPQTRYICAQAAEILRHAGAEALFDCDTVSRDMIPGGCCVSAQQAMRQCDAIVTVGGDGTLLRTARESLAWQKPLLGINLGRVGFLATCEVSEMPVKLTRLAKGDFMPDRRMLLEAIVSQPGKKPAVLTALNEVALFKGLRTQTMGLRVFCDDVPVSNYRGDGVILATPTGSTAYSLSAGGPILDAEILGMLLTPICAHSLQSPPMVFSAGRRLRVEVETEGDEPVYLSADGQHPPLAISAQSSVELGRAAQAVTLVRFNKADQFEAIDKKLIRKVTL